ncbi:protein kinase [Candidatus Uhrbacteria bacterium]|nr:protein kinase [Candidatus Uhrbacteria bacterium]
MTSDPVTSAVALDHYAALEVHPRARHSVIRAAYRVLAKEYAPDNASTGNADAFRRITAAHDVLADADRRAVYDGDRGKLEGKIVGERWRVLSRIAEGAIGKTYKGEHVLTRKPICIKFCAELDPQFGEIMLHEAEVMWDLHHYALPAIRDVFLHEEIVTLVMSYAPGLTIAQQVERYGRLPAIHVAWITDRILNALVYLHDEEVVHGDLKPQNVILSKPKKHVLTLVDFGLAMAKPRRDSENLGYTDYFSAPEQVAMRGPLVPASDFYALGMTMLYMLGGERGLLAKQVPEETPDPMSRFIQKIIVRDPLARRFRTQELCDEFQDVRVRSFGKPRTSLEPLPGAERAGT